MSCLIQVVSYNPTWPEQFDSIAAQLTTYLVAQDVKYDCIEHIGSTSVFGLAAKDNIDIVILVPNLEEALKAKDALIWQPSDAEFYKSYGNGGIRGRMSMKSSDRTLRPDRSVYIIRRDDSEGTLCLRCYRSLRDTLRKDEFNHLKQEYAQVKLALAAEQIVDGTEYGQRKNDIIRKILKADGWTDLEVDVKESLDTRVAGEPSTPPY